MIFTKRFISPFISPFISVTRKVVNLSNTGTYKIIRTTIPTVYTLGNSKILTGSFFNCDNTYIYFRFYGSGI